MSAWGMLKQGKVGDAAKRAVTWLLPAWLATLVLKLWDDLWAMAINTASSYAEKVLTGQLSIQEAATALINELARQSVTISREDALDAVRLKMIELKGDTNG